jgi:cyclophilin family peptidyl-prolyl cis-trans isomerase
MKNFIFITIGTLFFVTLLAFFSFNQENADEVEKELLINEENMNYIITLETTKGDIKFETYANDAPNTVNNFIKLAKEGFYNDIIFHRVIDGFMIQGGDPTGTGMGGPGYTFEDEINQEASIYQEGYKKGVVAMANAGPNTQGSQFFIMVADNELPPLYTIFGRVIEGQEVADAISLVETNENDKPLEDVVIKGVSIIDKE